MAKEQTLKVRVDEKDRSRLNAISEHLSVTPSSAVRMLIKERYDALKRSEKIKESA